MAKYKLSEKKRRTAVIQIRVTEDEKKRIQSKAAKNKQTVSDYSRDCCIAGLERKTSRDRKRILQDINRLENENKIIQMCKSENTIFEELKNVIIDHLEKEEWNWPV